MHSQKILRTPSLSFICLMFLTSSYTQQFQAIGNIDPSHRASEGYVGEVVVEFDLLPTKMSFNLPAFPCLVTENNISYYNGWAETYDATAGVGSAEPLMDNNNLYSRMWIESANDARIVVRWKAALMTQNEIIAHLSAPSVSPYGDGDWVDEWYTIFPDGTHIRKSRIYTYFAPQSKPFGWNREPPNYVHEFQEMLFYGEIGHKAEDDIETNALTLINMNGEQSTISYNPYPIHYNPTEQELYSSFGAFWDANIFVVNTKSEYHPFTIGRTQGVSISPYAPETPDPLPRTFVSWPTNPGPADNYGAALGHLINRTHYQKSDTSLTQIYLSGFTNSTSPETLLAPLARSWLQPPELKQLNTNVPAIIYGYDPMQKSYLMDYKTFSQPEAVLLELAANDSSPVVNPTFLINNWGNSIPEVYLNGIPLQLTNGYRYGFYNSIDIEDGRAWKDVLVVWIKAESSNPLHITIKPPGATLPIDKSNTPLRNFDLKIRQPSNHQFQFTVDLPKASQVIFSLFNTKGKRVAVIYQGHLESGENQINWRYPQRINGIYLYNFKAKGIHHFDWINLIRF